jgi:hypothetical protein
MRCAAKLKGQLDWTYTAAGNTAIRRVSAKMLKCYRYDGCEWGSRQSLYAQITTGTRYDRGHGTKCTASDGRA